MWSITANYGPRVTKDNLDDALYNLKLKAVTIVTEVLPWLALIGVLFIAVTVLA